MRTGEAFGDNEMMWTYSLGKRRLSLTRRIAIAPSHDCFEGLVRLTTGRLSYFARNSIGFPDY